MAPAPRAFKAAVLPARPGRSAWSILVELGRRPRAARSCEGRLAEAFDAALSRDGEPVSPRLIVDPSPSAGLRETASRLRGAVDAAERALSESVLLGHAAGERTTLDSSCCADASAKLGAVLRVLGLGVRAVEAEFHSFLMYDGPHGQILVDPTVRQFFGGPRAPPSVPRIFVGTYAELIDLFRRHAAFKTTKYDPARIYFKDARVNETFLREALAGISSEASRNKEIILPGRVPADPRQYEPLKEFLKLEQARP